MTLQPGEHQGAAIADSPTSARARAVAVALLLVGAVCAGMGQTIVFSVLPPLARELGLDDYQVGVIFMFSALCWVILGPRWGRRSDTMGRKPFILISLIGFAASMALFGGMIKLGLAGVLSGLPLYLLMVVTRSFYGTFGSAGPPAAQAYIADRTSARDRTAGIAGFSAAFGFGAMLGPGFGSLAALLGKVAPFFAMAGLAALMSIAVYVFLPERSKPVRREKHARVKLLDPRVRPFLMFGLGAGVINAIPIQTIAFYFIDRLGVSTDAAPHLVGYGLMGGAMASLTAQIVVVQRMRLTPRQLLRIAPALTVVGHGLIWAAPHLVTVILGMVLAGFGAGMAVPGFNAAASLSVEPDEQGATIGLANAAGASGFIVSPLLGFGLYALAPQAPYMFSMSLALALLIFALTSRAVGAARPEEPPVEAVSEPASAPYQ